MLSLWRHESERVRTTILVVLLSNRGRSKENGVIGQVGEVNSGPRCSVIVLFPRGLSIELSQGKLTLGRSLGLRSGVSKKVNISRHEHTEILTLSGHLYPRSCSTGYSTSDAGVSLFGVFSVQTSQEQLCCAAPALCRVNHY
jgi:hypothetical protein